MTTYMLRRVAVLVVSLLVASAVLFVLLRLLPGDPSNALVSVGATPEQIVAAQRQLGSDRPVLEQFATWIGQMTRFDLGSSFISSLPVGAEIRARLAVTVPLTLISFAVAVTVAVPLGYLAALHATHWSG